MLRGHHWVGMGRARVAACGAQKCAFLEPAVNFLTEEAEKCEKMPHFLDKAPQ
jgi:hypothetical protein